MKIVKFQTSYVEPYPLKVQGESFYKDNIENVSNYLGEDEGVNADDFIAHLILDEKNINDENAVRVEIDNKIVGYLSRPAAKLYRKKLKELGLENVIGECFASIRGGYIKRDGTQADFGVRLDLVLEDISLRIETPRTTQPKPPINKPQPEISEMKTSQLEQLDTRRTIIIKDMTVIIVLLVVGIFALVFMVSVILTS